MEKYATCIIKNGEEKLPLEARLTDAESLGKYCGQCCFSSESFRWAYRCRGSVETIERERWTGRLP